MSGREDAGEYAAYQAAMEEQANQSIPPDAADAAANQSIIVDRDDILAAQEQANQSVPPDAADAAANQSMVADRDDILAAQGRDDNLVAMAALEQANQSVQPDFESVMSDPEDILAGDTTNQTVVAVQQQARAEQMVGGPGDTLAGTASVLRTLPDEAVNQQIKTIRERLSVPESYPEREADSRQLDMLEREQTIREIARLDEPGLDKLLHGIMTGSTVLRGVAEAVEIFHVAGRIGKIAAVISTAGAVVEVVEIGMEILDSFETLEKIAYAQGVCYGIMYQTLNMSDRDLQLPKDWPVLDRDEVLEAWRSGLLEGRSRATTPSAHNRLVLAIAGEAREMGDDAPFSVLNNLWQSVRSDLRAGERTSEVMDWPEPRPYNPRH
jgi:hypothetical protein